MASPQPWTKWLPLLAPRALPLVQYPKLCLRLQEQMSGDAFATFLSYVANHCWLQDYAAGAC